MYRGSRIRTLIRRSRWPNWLHYRLRTEKNNWSGKVKWISTRHNGQYFLLFRTVMRLNQVPEYFIDHCSTCFYWANNGMMKTEWIEQGDPDFRCVSNWTNLFTKKKSTKSTEMKIISWKFINHHKNIDKTHLSRWAYKNKNLQVENNRK